MRPCTTRNKMQPPLAVDEFADRISPSRATQAQYLGRVSLINTVSGRLWARWKAEGMNA